MELVQGPRAGETVPKLQRQAKKGRTGVLPSDGHTLRRLHVPDAARSEPRAPRGHHIRLHHSERVLAGVVQDGGAQEQILGRRPSPGLAFGQRSALGVVVPQGERGLLEGLSGLGSPPGLPNIRVVALEVEVLCDVELWNVRVVLGGGDRTFQVGGPPNSTGERKISFQTFLFHSKQILSIS